MVILILAGECVFLLPFVLPRLFRPTLLEVFQIDNTQLGYMFSLYGLVAIPAYLFGGPIADRFAPNKLMAIALFSTGIGGLVMGLTLNPSSLLWIYGAWGFTTIFLFWAALFKTTRLVSSDSHLGSSFGILDGGRGLAAAVIGTGAVWLLSLAITSDFDSINAEEKRQAFRSVIFFFTFCVFGAGALVWFGLNNLGKSVEREEKKFTWNKIKKAVRLPEVWLQALIILCAYTGYRVTDNFSLLANDVLGYNHVDSAFVGTLALWLRPISAVLAGFLADRTKTSNMILICFLILALSGTLMGVTTASFASLGVILCVISSTCVGVFALRGLYFAIMGESKIPIEITGTIVGIASVIGYLPDIFMAPLMGYFLDNFSGINGHRLVFLLLIEFSLIGIVAVSGFKYVLGNRSKTTIE